MTAELTMEMKQGPGAPATRVTRGMRVVVVRTLDPARRHLEGRDGQVIGFDWDIPILQVGGEVISGIECYWGPRDGFPGMEVARALADARPAATLLIWSGRAA